MRKYLVTWLDASCEILATTEFSAASLGEAIREAYGAASREDGEGAEQCNIELVEIEGCEAP